MDPIWILIEPTKNQIKKDYKYHRMYNTMHEGASGQKVQSRAVTREIRRSVRTSPTALWQQTPTDRS